MNCRRQKMDLKNPAKLIDPHLLAIHVAVCANPFPLMQELPAERLIAYLLDVPGLAQRLSFRWQLLDQPPVGSTNT